MGEFVFRFSKEKTIFVNKKTFCDFEYLFMIIFKKIILSKT